MRKNMIAAACLLLAMGACGLQAQNKYSQWAVDNYRKYYNEARQTTVSSEKEKAIEDFRQYYGENIHRAEDWHGKKLYEKFIGLLKADGTFSDLDDRTVGKPDASGNAAQNGGAVTQAYNRLWEISEAFRAGKYVPEKDRDLWDRLQKSVLHYGQLEINRSNESVRFHSSCFAIPKAAVNIYFCHLAQMDAVEQDKVHDDQLKAVCDMLKTVALQAWTQPLRHDDTDNNVVQIDRFRHHVWWVGGNALDYRPLLPVAFMYRSVPMVDLLAEIAQRCIGTASQNTYETAFWNEGFTADGAGWGHGRQCLIWGYPIDGTLGALRMLQVFKGSPWEQKLSKENTAALMNYFRGGNYYYYKGYVLPCVDRGSMRYIGKPSAIRYASMLKMLIDGWADSFTADELAEMKQLYAEARANDVRMAGYEAYNGTRWFFNNDDLIKKNDHYHVMINMASVRCDGLESANGFADGYNYYTNDGATLFQRTGNEYRNIFGAFDVTAFPGVTAREGMEKLPPVTNWRGYCSRHNFAGGATFGGENAVAGYIFEKVNANDKQAQGHGKESPVLFGVKAYKSYFMLGDYIVALGAGITNLTPEVEGRIRTTIDQTEHTGKIYELKGRKGCNWVVQEGKFAYSVFPEYRKNMHYVCEKKKTDWVKMNPENRRNKDLPAEVDVFRMWIDHGPRPADDTYGYVVYAGEGNPDRSYPFEVLRNDTGVQAVRSADRRVTEAVFYDAGQQLEAKGLSLSVSAPCVLLVEEQGKGQYRIAVTDARMAPDCTSIRVTLNGKTVDCRMPQGELGGKPGIARL